MFYDLHTHILPIDDGAKSIEESLEMLELEIVQEVNKILVTPHFNHPKKTKLSREEIVQAFQNLKEIIADKKMNLEICLGSEIYYQPNLSKLLEEKDYFSMNNTPYLLLEFHFYKEEDFDEIAYVCKHYQMIPIIAHPERYEYIKSVRDIEYLKELGFMIQINSTSFQKTFKKSKLVHKLLNLKMIDFIASDCHDTKMRKPDLKDLYHQLKTKKNEDYLNQIFFENPKRFFPFE